MRPIAERHGLTMLQLACQWNLAQAPVRVRRADADPGGRRRREADRGQARRARRGAARVVLSADEVAEIRAIGDNTGCMALKGAVPDYEGEERPDRWALTPECVEVGARWGIDPARDLAPA